MELPINQIICGSALEVLPRIKTGIVSCSISSPPYWALRDYGTEPSIWDGDKNCKHCFELSAPPRRNRNETDVINLNSKQATVGGSNYNATNSQFCSKCGAWLGCLGLEPTFELYIKHLCDIYDQVKRVLRKDGTCFVNLGDTYANNPSNNQGKGIQNSRVGLREGARSLGRQNRNIKTVPQKSLCLIPQRFAIEMVNRGWILRNVIIWHKRNPMPSSAKDRFTVDFEYVYFFVKSKKYWFEPQYEPMNYPERIYNSDTSSQKWNDIDNRLGKGLDDGRTQYGNAALGRNKRCVWTIPTQPYPEAHFATYPEKLVEPMIKAGCPEFICTKCGKAREKIWDRPKLPDELRNRSEETKMSYHTMQIGGGQKIQDWYDENPKSIIGYTDCGCKDREWRPGIVLDCFRGQMHNRQSSHAA